MARSGNGNLSDDLETKSSNYYNGMPIDLYVYTIYIEFPFVCLKSTAN